MPKPTKRLVGRAKTWIRLGIRTVWSECLLSAWSWFGSLATHKVHSKVFFRLGWSGLCCVHRSIFSFVMLGSNTVWSASWQNQQNGMCALRRRIILGRCPVWSESSLSAWRKLGSLATHWVHRQDSDQTGRMPRLSLPWAQSFCWFCHEAAHLILNGNKLDSGYLRFPWTFLFIL